VGADLIFGHGENFLALVGVMLIRWIVVASAGISAQSHRTNPADSKASATGMAMSNSHVTRRASKADPAPHVEARQDQMRPGDCRVGDTEIDSDIAPTATSRSGGNMRRTSPEQTVIKGGGCTQT
jgi:hypothetical protein